MNPLVKIQKAIITDDLEAAISDMLSLSKDSRLQNQVISVSGRYHSNERGNNMGTLTPDHYNRTRNQLRHVLQELIKDFPDYSADVFVEANNALAAENSSKTNTSSSTTTTATPPPEDGIFKILMLSSNPSSTAKLKLRDEYAFIASKILNSDHSSKYSIRSRESITASRFTEALLEEKPNLLHFSGHGELKNKQAAQDDTTRGLRTLQKADTIKGENSGIILSDEDNREELFVPTTVIRRWFRNIVSTCPIEAVVFNSCYSEAQAEALADLIPHVIGTSWSVTDKGAIAFTTGFYSSLARTDNNIELAWDNGVSLAMIQGEPEEKFIYFKNGKKVSAG
jgi:hypothetical protein